MSLDKICSTLPLILDSVVICVPLDLDCLECRRKAIFISFRLWIKRSFIKSNIVSKNQTPVLETILLSKVFKFDKVSLVWRLKYVLTYISVNLKLYLKTTYACIFRNFNIRAVVRFSNPVAIIAIFSVFRVPKFQGCSQHLWNHPFLTKYINLIFEVLM